MSETIYSLNSKIKHNLNKELYYIRKNIQTKQVVHVTNKIHNHVNYVVNTLDNVIYMVYFMTV